MSESRTPPLSIESLQVSYRASGPSADAKANRHVAIDGLTFSIDAGEAFGLVGESGSGKSTVAMAIARYLSREARIDAGSIRVAGQDVGSLGTRALRTLRRDHLAFVYQDPARALNPTLTIGRQLVEAFELAGTRDQAAHTAALEMLDRVRMPSPARALASYPHQMSGGMQQRAVIAMALAKSPTLLILDEATTGLDATVEAEIIALVDSLRRASGTALLFISHKLPLVAGLCDRVGILEHGRLVEEGAPARIFAQPSHRYTAALIACIPTLGRTRHDGPLATLEDADVRDRGAEGATAPLPTETPAAKTISARTTRATTTPAETGPADHAPAHAKADPSAVEPLDAPIESSRVLDARGLTKHYRIGHETVCALDHVSIDLREGETLGLVGESGSGKTTLARIIAGLETPEAGALSLDGAALPSRVEKRSRAQTSALQSVFQNPQSALNRAHRLRTLLGRAVDKLAGLRGEARDQRVRALLDAVHLPHSRLNARARELSGGQQQRVAIARAFAGQPRIVICDEPTSALDVSVQAAILNLLVELQRTQRASYVFISHDLPVVRYIADRVAVLYRGQIVECGPADRLFDAPRHPYTAELLRAASGPVRSGSRSESSAHRAATAGCIYAATCPSSLGARCENERPADIRISDTHTVRCHLYRESDTGA